MKKNLTTIKKIILFLGEENVKSGTYRSMSFQNKLQIKNFSKPLEREVGRETERVKRGTKRELKAFTLVEILVVVTIIAILGLISFITIQGYTQETRDAKRYSDITELYKKIEFEKTIGLEIHEAVKQTSTGKIMIGGTLQTTNIGIIDFNKIKQASELFKDPKTQEDYEIAYSNGIYEKETSKEVYEFIQLRAKSEVNEGEYIVVGKYYQINKELDAKNLFDVILDCEEQKLNGYELPKEENGNTQIKDKEINIGNGVHKYRQEFKCENGEYKPQGEEEDLGIICDTKYALNGEICVLDVCSGSIPEGANMSSTQESYTESWHYSTTPGICTFQCKDTHYWNSTNNTCELIVYDWYAGAPYGSCNSTCTNYTSQGCTASCGGGHYQYYCSTFTSSKTITVECRRQDTQGKVNDSFCTTTKPSTTETCSGTRPSSYTSGNCNTGACVTYSWAGTYGARGNCTCNSNANGSKWKTRTITVYCRSSDGAQVSDGYCSGTKPSGSTETVKCTLSPCYDDIIDYYSIIGRTVNCTIPGVQYRSDIKDVKYQGVLTKTLRCQMLQSTMTLSITESTAANECTTVAVLMNARAEATKWYSNEGCP